MESTDLPMRISGGDTVFALDGFSELITILKDLSCYT